MSNTTKDYKFLDTTLNLTHQSTEHTVRLIQSEIGGGYGKIFNLDFAYDDVILDIGANLGIISILLSKKFPTTKIYSFEASPINYNNFVQNIKNNNCTNITPFNLAVWSESNQTVDISTSPTNSGGSSIFYTDSFHEQYPTSNVQTISLKDIFDQNNIEKCKLLKVDIEGAEYPAFKSLPQDYIDNKIENLAIEYHNCISSKEYSNLKEVIEQSPINVVCTFNAGGGKLKK